MSSLQLKLREKGFEASTKDLEEALVLSDNNIVRAMSHLVGKSMSTGAEGVTSNSSSEPTYAEVVLGKGGGPQRKRLKIERRDSLDPMDKPKRPRPDPPPVPPLPLPPRGGSFISDDRAASNVVMRAAGEILSAHVSASADETQLLELSASKSMPPGAPPVNKETLIAQTDDLNIHLAKLGGALLKGVVEWGTACSELRHEKIGIVGRSLHIKNIDRMPQQKDEITKRLGELFVQLDSLHTNQAQQKKHVYMAAERIVEVRKGIHDDFCSIRDRHRTAFSPNNNRHGDELGNGLETSHPDAELWADMIALTFEAQNLDKRVTECTWIKSRQQDCFKHVRDRIKLKGEELSRVSAEKDESRKQLQKSTELKAQTHARLLEQLHKNGSAGDLSLMFDAIQGLNGECARLHRERQDAVAAEVHHRSAFAEKNATYLTLSCTHSVNAIVAETVGQSFHEHMGMWGKEVESVVQELQRALDPKLKKLSRSANSTLKSRCERVAAAKRSVEQRSEELTEHHKLFGQEAPETERRLTAMMKEMMSVQEASISAMTMIGMQLKKLYLILQPFWPEDSLAQLQHDVFEGLDQEGRVRLMTAAAGQQRQEQCCLQ
jgi:hypothetical protein